MLLSSSILLTLKYSAYFSFPLQENEIYLRLIKCRTSRHKLKSALAHLVQNGKIYKTKGYYHLPGDHDFITNRLSRGVSARPLRHRARTLVSQLFSLPGILAFYLTGSLAVGNSSEDEDIDLLVITSPHVLWITRFFLTLTTTLLGLRRTRTSAHFQGKLCLNLYLTPDSFAVPPSRRSLYTAYELIQAVPLYDPHHTYPHLLVANSWLKEYLPNFEFPNLQSSDLCHFENQNIILRIFEPLAYYLQYAYMKPHLTREFVTRDCAYFHPQNPGYQVLKNLKLSTRY